MLSRIGNSLFWLGRYIERAEHFARFTRVQYLSSLDAPLAQKKQFVLESILDMIGYQYQAQHFEDDNKLSDEEVLHYVSLDENNLDSVIAAVNAARENARGARDTISSELWEAVNKYYHAVNDYPADEFRKEGPFDFSEIIYQNSSIVKGFIDNTHIHNEQWALINLGLHMERAIQIARIILAKLNDIEKIDQAAPGSSSIINYQVSTLLKSAESFDMSRKYFKKIPNLTNALDFLILNFEFPKSISFNLNQASLMLNKMNLADVLDKNTPEFKLAKLASYYKFLTIEEVGEVPKKFLEQTLLDIYEVGGLLEKKYLSY